MTPVNHNISSNQTNPKAWYFQGMGKDLFCDTQIKPSLNPDEVLIENLAIGINPVDWKLIGSNIYQNNHIPGVDGAGVIVATGSHAPKSIIGQRVAYHQSLNQQGSFATFTKIKNDRFIPISDDLSFELAAALPCPLLTAWQAVEKLPIQAAARVLLAGLGSVNKFIAQLLQKRGFEVYALSKSIKEDQAKDIGIKGVYKNISDIDQSFFAIIDAVGTENAKALVPYLLANGHIISILGRIEHAIDAPFTKNISYHEVALGAMHQYGDKDQWQRLMQSGQQLFKAVASGEIKVDSPQIFKFSQLLDALELSSSQHGKAVVSD